MTFSDQVDACLTTLEARAPRLHRLRRVPMDLIADAVARQLETTIKLGAVRVVRWSDDSVQRALLVVAARHGDVIQAPVVVLR